MTQATLFDISSPGKRAVRMPDCDVPERPVGELLGADALRAEPPSLPEVTEPELARHYANLAQRTFAVDLGFYPLGSCTMKYNPKVNERAAGLPGFSCLHPLQPDETVQGALELIWELERYLCEIGGFDAASLQPPAGASGEFTCMRLIRAYHEARGDERRKRVLVPDTAHGTNPASVVRCGFTPTQIESDERGRVSLSALEQALGDDVAAIMLTNPNTLGLFEDDILQVAEMVHEAGALLYCDGANMNATMGIARPGDMGFDCMHFNLHKTFSTPHGGGGPGAGPIAVKEHLEPYLPDPRIVRDGDDFRLEWKGAPSIGKVHGFLHARVRARRHLDPTGPRRPHLGHRQAAHGLRLPSAHGVLPAHRQRGHHDRADGDGEQGDAGRVH